MSDLMQTLPIKKIIHHSPTLKSFYFDKPFSAQPGQFINLWLPGMDEKPFSISMLTDHYLELSIKAYGPFTKKLMTVKEGDLLGIRGPFGHGFRFIDNSLIIAGGIGIAPLRFLAYELAKRDKKFVTIIGATTKEQVIFLDFFQQLSPTYLYTDDGSLGSKGVVTQDLEAIIHKHRIRFVYAAGPEVMYVHLQPLLEKLDLDYEFAMERYMKCGIGICGQCVLDDSGIRVCVEGPVITRAMLGGVTELGLPHRDATGKRKGG